MTATLDDILSELRRLNAALRGSEWMTVAQAAAALDVSDATIRRRIRSGEIEARGVGKTRRVRL